MRRYYSVEKIESDIVTLESLDGESLIVNLSDLSDGIKPGDMVYKAERWIVDKKYTIRRKADLAKRAKSLFER